MLTHFVRSDSDNQNLVFPKIEIRDRYHGPNSTLLTELMADHMWEVQIECVFSVMDDSGIDLMQERREENFQRCITF